ncbi:MAG: amidohydrolase, partial [Azospira oryzae]
MKLILYTFFGVFLMMTACTSKKQPADTVILGGRIYTANEQQVTVEAVAIKGDTIAFAGTEKEVREWIGDHTEVIDLKGKTMTPGFIESH